MKKRNLGNLALSGLTALAMTGCQDPGNPGALLGLGLMGAGINQGNAGAAVVGRAIVDHSIAEAGRDEINIVVNPGYSSPGSLYQARGLGGIRLASLADSNGDGAWNKETEEADFNASTFYNDSHMLILARGDIYGGQTVNALIRDYERDLVGKGNEIFVPEKDNSLEVIGHMDIRALNRHYQSQGIHLRGTREFCVEIYQDGRLLEVKPFQINFSERSPRKIEFVQRK